MCSRQDETARSHILGLSVKVLRKQDEKQRGGEVGV